MLWRSAFPRVCTGSVICDRGWELPRVRVSAAGIRTSYSARIASRGKTQPRPGNDSPLSALHSAVAAARVELPRPLTTDLQSKRLARAAASPSEVLTHKSLWF